MNLAYIKVMIFLVLGIMVFFGGHFFLYRSFANFFGISSSSVKTVLFIVILLLSLSFVISSVVAHFNQGPVAKYFYVFSVSWLGLAINLAMAAALVILTKWLLGLFEIKPNIQYLSFLFFALAIIVSTWGAWNAFHPKVKNVEISIKNLPPQWQGKTIVQLSDIHLGHIHGPEFLQEIVNESNAQNPDLVLITGDLFDGMDGDLNAFLEPLRELKAKSGIFFVTGNHETFLGTERAFSILEKTKIKVLNDELVNIDGLQIIGVSYPEIDAFNDIVGDSKSTASVLASLKDFDSTKPSILLHHAPSNLTEAKQNGISLQLSGHSHEGQIFPFNFVTGAIYGKYQAGLQTDGDFKVYTTPGTGTWGPPMRIGNTPEIVNIKIK